MIGKSAASHSYRPALFTDLSVSTAAPSQVTGWTTPASYSFSYFVFDNWKAGRIWVYTPASVAVDWLLTALLSKGPT
ncbi:hypothetical protein H4582DRAFT_1279702 [Lactarius indigo]|nr:hypothetical protein H4582DRAFT_1279702 [Lactarius indigo]